MGPPDRRQTPALDRPVTTPHLDHTNGTDTTTATTADASMITGITKPHHGRYGEASHLSAAKPHSLTAPAIAALLLNRSVGAV
ncbi:hypothetical protein SHO565_70960 [Streptomyces sp. HO565]